MFSFIYRPQSLATIREKREATEHVKKVIDRFGYYPALCILKELEDWNCFEICSYYKKVLDEMTASMPYFSSTTDAVSMQNTYIELKKRAKEPQIWDVNMPTWINEYRKHLFIFPNRQSSPHENKNDYGSRIDELRDNFDLEL